MTTQALEKCISGTKEERLFLCEKSFGLFCIYYFQDYFKYQLAPYHYDFIQDIEDLAEGKIREVLWIGFRESAKTTFAQLALLWLICYKRKAYINVDAYSGNNSERSLFDVAFQLLSNKRLIADFGRLYTRERKMDEMKQNKVDNFTTTNNIRVEASTTQVDVRGRKHFEFRPDYRWLDDFETMDTRDSTKVTLSIQNNMSSAIGGMAPTAGILYTANYLTEHGNVQWLLERAKSDEGIRVRNIPVMRDGVPTWESKYAMTDDEALKTGKVSIEDKQRQLGSYAFSYEMMNLPVDNALAEFKQEYIQYETEDFLKGKDTTCYITIDSAVSEKESADFTGVTINRITNENKWYIKTYRLKINSKDLIDHLFYLKKEYNPNFLGLEETTFTMAIQPFLEEEMRKRSIFMTVTPVKHRGVNKHTRIRGLIPRWENKSIFLIGDNPELLDEMRVFPNGVHDDVLDSLAMQLPHARAPHRPPLTLRDETPLANHAI